MRRRMEALRSTVAVAPQARSARLARRTCLIASMLGLLVFFGTAPLGIAENDYAGRLATWREWQPVAELAQGDVQ